MHTNALLLGALLATALLSTESFGGSFLPGSSGPTLQDFLANVNSQLKKARILLTDGRRSRSKAISQTVLADCEDFLEHSDSNDTRKIRLTASKAATLIGDSIVGDDQSIWLGSDSVLVEDAARAYFRAYQLRPNSLRLAFENVRATIMNNGADHLIDDFSLPLFNESMKGFDKNKNGKNHESRLEHTLEAWGNAMSALGRPKASAAAFRQKRMSENSGHCLFKKLTGSPDDAPDFWGSAKNRVCPFGNAIPPPPSMIKFDTTPEQGRIPLSARSVEKCPAEASPITLPRFAVNGGAKLTSNKKTSFPRRKFVMMTLHGMHHCGTSSLYVDLMRLYRNGVTSPFFVALEWKHTMNPIRHTSPFILNLISVKDPLFWIKSIIRVPSQIPYNRSNIAAPFKYQGKIRQGLAGLWNDSMRMYTTEFSDLNSVIVRNEDLLFRWKDVMVTLYNDWLHLPKLDAQVRALGGIENFVDNFTRSSEVAKDEEKRSRNLSEALAYYGNISNRVVGWTKAEMVYLRCTLDEELMIRFNYQWEKSIGLDECKWFNQL
jgi:hypothetical protein